MLVLKALFSFQHHILKCLKKTLDKCFMANILSFDACCIHATLSEK